MCGLSDRQDNDEFKQYEGGQSVQNRVIKCHFITQKPKMVFVSNRVLAGTKL